MEGTELTPMMSKMEGKRQGKVRVSAGWIGDRYLGPLQRGAEIKDKHLDAISNDSINHGQCCTDMQLLCW